MEENNVIQFLRRKDYKFIKDIGQGGTGRTVLLYDETIDAYFVCKKYSPYYEEDKPIYFKHFVDEIKLLHLLNHRNVVRVFNYYLFAERTTGYILMEYIDGADILTYLTKHPDYVTTVFEQVVEGFLYLERHNILHRDIRFENILVASDGLVKIIDFGFGKRMNLTGDPNSVSLNWAFSIPDEFKDNVYDFRTEVYFVGKLFEALLSSLGIEGFRHKHIVKQMIAPHEKRIKSFFDVDRAMLQGEPSFNEFSAIDKVSYQAFARPFTEMFGQIYKGTFYKEDIPKIIEDLNALLRDSVLEDNIQNPWEIGRCFLQGQFKYIRSVEISTDTLRDFTNFFRGLSADKQKIVLNHLWKRFDGISRYDPDDELPF